MAAAPKSLTEKRTARAAAGTANLARKIHGRLADVEQTVEMT
jgi:hypothetical protein